MQIYVISGSKVFNIMVNGISMGYMFAFQFVLFSSFLHLHHLTKLINSCMQVYFYLTSKVKTHLPRHNVNDEETLPTATSRLMRAPKGATRNSE